MYHDEMTPEWQKAEENFSSKKDLIINHLAIITFKFMTFAKFSTK